MKTFLSDTYIRLCLANFYKKIQDDNKKQYTAEENSSLILYIII